MKKILLGVLILFASLSAFAQQRTGYFVDSYLYNHQMNPAFAPGQGYIGICNHRQTSSKSKRNGSYEHHRRRRRQEMSYDRRYDRYGRYALSRRASFERRRRN